MNLKDREIDLNNLHFYNKNKSKVVNSNYIKSAVVKFDKYLHSIRHDDYFDIQDTRKKFYEIFGDWKEL